MSVSHKSSTVQAFRLMLYQRALHPELFDLQARRRERQGDYEVESWVSPAGHVVRFQVGAHCLTECVIDRGDHLPETGLAYALPCLGEKDFELSDPTTAGGKLGYVTTIQTENLTENLYQATLREMHDFIGDTNALSHAWRSPEGFNCLSLLDAQKYRREYHVQSYHLLGVNGLVLRTQSIFEIK